MFSAISLTSRKNHMEKSCPVGCINRRRGWHYYYMNFKYAKVCTFYNIATSQMEGGKTNSNLTHPISKWFGSKFMVLLLYASIIEYMSYRI
jgi:hypothetical protein